MRCAIYTRKSTEEGLDQEFNSLDAQRDAAEAFILSQRQEGWVCLSARYDDGGFTGSNLNRPALDQMMADVRNKQIDCIVVYKVDRLTRSLSDFVALMSDFEKHGVTFVSVTQQFNTTTSMGRLTLNILLSFAQFERELISERTRDKIAYARRNGKWGGGRAALGYRISKGGGRLEPEPMSAQYVQAIFSTYLHCGSLRQTAKLVSLEYPDRPPLTAARIQYILGSPLYIGKITHRGTQYDGEHESLIDQEKWWLVQNLLHANCVNSSGRRQRSESLLQKLLICGVCGASMVHSTTRKNRISYRYYTCCSADGDGSDRCREPSVSAAALEAFVLRQLQRLVKLRGDEPSLVEFVLGEFPSQVAVPSVLHDWNRFSPAQKRNVCELLIAGVDYRGSSGALTLRIREDVSSRWYVAEDKACEIPFHISCGRYGKKRYVDGPPPIVPKNAQGRIPLVSRLMALAIHFDDLRRLGVVRNQSEVARIGSITRARMSQIMNLLNLAPEIQEQLLSWPRVLSGRDPVVLRDLLAVCNEPDWTIQSRLWKELTLKVS